MEWKREDIDDLLDAGIAALRNNVATDSQIEEAASRVVRNLQIDLPPTSRPYGGSQGESE